ncbi:DUF4334 domain-containing protein [Mycobacterium sp. NPDC003323]
MIWSVVCVATGMEMTQHNLAAAFDALPPVTIDALRGLWRPDTSYAETPGGRVLLESGWYGMRFTDSESVDPLLFRTADGTGLFAADLSKVLEVLTQGPADISMHREIVAAHGPTARLRMVHYRGVTSATLIYDRVPIMDYIRAVDADTVVGAVEARGTVEAPVYAVLRRA